MRIDAYNQINQIYQTKGVKKTQGSSKVMGKDQVTISRAGAEFNLLQQALKTVPDVREDLVNDIKNRMDEGSYNVSGESFADKLLQRYNELQGM